MSAGKGGYGRRGTRTRGQGRAATRRRSHPEGATDAHGGAGEYNGSGGEHELPQRSGRAVVEAYNNGFDGGRGGIGQGPHIAPVGVHSRLGRGLGTADSGDGDDGAEKGDRLDPDAMVWLWSNGST